MSIRPNWPLVCCPHCKKWEVLDATLARVNEAVGRTKHPAWYWVCPDCLYPGEVVAGLTAERTVRPPNLEEIAALVCRAEFAPVRAVVERLLDARVRARLGEPIGGPP